MYIYKYIYVYMYKYKHEHLETIPEWLIIKCLVIYIYDDDDDVYLIGNYNMVVGYKIYLHTEPDRTA
jgi:hypothetical protein